MFRGRVRSERVLTRADGAAVPGAGTLESPQEDLLAHIGMNGSKTFNLAANTRVVRLTKKAGVLLRDGLDILEVHFRVLTINKRRQFHVLREHYLGISHCAIDNHAVYPIESPAGS